MQCASAACIHMIRRMVCNAYVDQCIMHAHHVFRGTSTVKRFARNCAEYAFLTKRFVHEEVVIRRGAEVAEPGQRRWS